MLAAVRLVKRGDAKVQCDLDTGVVKRGRETQQGTHHLANTTIVIIHIGQGIAEVGVLMENRLVMERGGLVIYKILQINIQCLGDLIQGLHIDGDCAVLIF